MVILYSGKHTKTRSVSNIRRDTYYSRGLTIHQGAIMKDTDMFHVG
jgi:hypothetical protein